MLGLSLGGRFLALMIGFGLGFWCLLKTRDVGLLVGPIAWAEQHLGTGGTYSFVKLIGVGLIILSIVLFFEG